MQNCLLLLYYFILTKLFVTIISLQVRKTVCYYYISWYLFVFRHYPTSSCIPHNVLFRTPRGYAYTMLRTINLSVTPGRRISPLRFSLAGNQFETETHMFYYMIMVVRSIAILLSYFVSSKLFCPLFIPRSAIHSCNNHFTIFLATLLFLTIPDS